jgi:AhpD family alkylhydroperoxidase
MSWKDFLKETNGRLAALQKENPKTFEGFGVMGATAKKEGALSEKTKEFIALGIAISTMCDSCIAFHTKSLVRLCATREEFNEALAMCSYMGGGPALAYSAKALEAYDEFTA